VLALAGPLSTHRTCYGDSVKNDVTICVTMVLQ
jgi:hypothetical protein